MAGRPNQTPELRESVKSLKQYSTAVQQHYTNDNMVASNWFRNWKSKRTPDIITYYMIDLYRLWKIACGRADIALATGWYNVNDRRLQTAAYASATDISDWLLQAARHCVADM